MMEPQSPRRVGRSLAKSAWMLALALAAGCTTLGPADSKQLSSDMYKLRTRLDESIAKQESNQLALVALMDSVKVEQAAQKEMVGSSVGDIIKRLQLQIQESERLNQKVAELAYAVDRINTRLGIGGNGSTEAGNPGLTSPPPGTNGGGAETIQPTPPPEIAAEPPLRESALEQYISTAHSAHNAGKFDEARTALKHALELQPSEDQVIEILFWLGENSYSLKDYQAAEQYYINTISKRPTSPKAWACLEKLAMISRDTGELQTALERYKQFEERNPSYPEIERVRKAIAEIGQELSNQNKSAEPPAVAPIATAPPAP